MCMQSLNKLFKKLTNITTGNSFHKNGHCSLDLWPADLKNGHCSLDLWHGHLKINRCLKTNTGNVYAKSQFYICKTDKDSDCKWFSQKWSLCSLDLWPGDLKINRCLKTNIGNVYSKSQYYICKTDKHSERKPQCDWLMDGWTELGRTTWKHNAFRTLGIIRLMMMMITIISTCVPTYMYIQSAKYIKHYFNLSIRKTIKYVCAF